MVQGIVAVEAALTNVIDLLETEGYEVVPLDNCNVEEVDAIIVNGADINLMNIQDALTEVPVISAVGKTATEILEELGKL